MRPFSLTYLGPMYRAIPISRATSRESAPVLYRLSSEPPSLSEDCGAASSSSAWTERVAESGRLCLFVPTPRVQAPLTPAPRSPSLPPRSKKCFTRSGSSTGILSRADRPRRRWTTAVQKRWYADSAVSLPSVRTMPVPTPRVQAPLTPAPRSPSLPPRSKKCFTRSGPRRRR
jgi:hypothetical protein